MSHPGTAHIPASLRVEGVHLLSVVWGAVSREGDTGLPPEGGDLEDALQPASLSQQGAGSSPEGPHGSCTACDMPATPLLSEGGKTVLVSQTGWVSHVPSNRDRGLERAWQEVLSSQKEGS